MINSAMIALKFGSTDTALLSYVAYLSEVVSVRDHFFLHVIQQNSREWGAYQVETHKLMEGFNLKSEIRKNIRSSVEEFFSPHPDKNYEYIIKEGYPLEELVYSAKLKCADLVIIGQNTHAIHHNILARNFIRQVESDALVVPDKSVARMRNILVPVDFSAHSVKALQKAVAVNRHLEKPARITCLNVYGLPNLQFFNVEKTRSELKTIIEKDRALAFRSFIESNIPNQKDRENIHTSLVERQQHDPGFLINEYAHKEEKDIIIMGAKGHTRAGLLLMGSVTERVLGLNREIPVWIIK